MLKKTLLSAGAIASVIVPTLVNAQIVNFEDTTKYPTREEASKTGESKKLVLETDGYTDVTYKVTEETEKIKTGRTEEVETSSTTSKSSIEGLSLEDANSKKDELEGSSTKEKTIAVTISAARTVSDGKLDSSVTDKVFASQNELDNEVASLREAGYTVTITSSTELTTSVTKTLEGTYDTEEEAQAKVEEFNTNYNTTAGSYGAERNTEKDTVIIISESFSTEAEANAYKNSLDADSVNVTISSSSSDTESETKTATLTSEREANNKKREFEDSFEVVESSTITKNEKGTAKGITVVNPYEKSYTVTESDYVVITHGNERIVWTKTSLNDKEKENFKRTYNLLAPNQVKLNGRIEFKSGFGEIKPGIRINANREGILRIELPPHDISHLVYGAYQGTTEFVVSTTGHNTTTTYTVTGSTTDYGYDYVVSGSTSVEELNGKVKASYKATKAKYKDVYDLSIETTTKTFETVDIYEDNTYYVLNISADDEAIMGEGGEEIDPEETKEETTVEVVQTGSDFDYSIMSSAAITLTLAGLVAYTKRRRD